MSTKGKHEGFMQNADATPFWRIGQPVVEESSISCVINMAGEGMGCAGGGCGGDGTGRVVPQEVRARRRVFFSGRYREQQRRTDFCVPKYGRDSFNLTTSVESGLLVDGSSGASTEEGLALGAVGCGRGWVTVTLV